MRGTNYIRRVGAAAILAFTAQFASAQFITQDSATLGDDAFVVDTLSGLTWLNLNVTRGLSYDAVVNQLALDPALAEFHIATYTEVGALFHDAGFSVDIPTGNLTDPARLAANASFADAFIGLPPGTPPYSSSGEFFLGNTFLGNALPSSPNLNVSGVSYTSGSGVVPTAFTDSTGPHRDAAVAYMSTWVVSNRPISPVPEPETYALMLVGFAALGAVTRRRASVPSA